MRQNIFAAITQTGSSLGIALLSIAIFRVLTPDQISFLRQHYFVPFALMTSFSPANQNYLRSILFSKELPRKVQCEILSLTLVQTATGGLLLVAIILSIATSRAEVSLLNMVALLSALVLVLTRTLVTGSLEFRGRYNASIVLNNLGAAIPYVAAYAVVLFSQNDSFFLSTATLNMLNLLLVILIGLKLLTPSTWEFVSLRRSGFQFSFRRYSSLSLISIGSVVVYQGVEFSLYNYTGYPHAQIASYALAFSVSAIMRQVILTAIQPLENERSHGSMVNLPMVGPIRRPIAVEILIYVLLIGSVLTLPIIFAFAFPKFEEAGTFVPPLILGVLGSAIQQVYSVRMIAESRTAFLGSTQVFLALACILVTLFLNSSLSLNHVIWLTSGFTWLRGCLVIPLYAELTERRRSRRMWALRIALSAALFSFLN